MLIKSKWFVTSKWQATDAGKVFGSLDKLYETDGAHVTSDKQSSVVRKEVGGHHFYVKLYHCSTGLRSWVGRSRIRLEAKNQLWFNQIGVPAASVVAYGEDYLLGKTLRGGLVTAEELNTRDLAWVASHHPERFKDAFWVDSVASQVAEVTRTLHEHRFAHNDLKWRNILVTQSNENPEISLIDCPTGQRWPGFLLKRRIIKDLACLDKLGKYYLSRTQRMRFFLKYRSINRLNQEDKKMIRRVLCFFEGRE